MKIANMSAVHGELFVLSDEGSLYIVAESDGEWFLADVHDAAEPQEPTSEYKGWQKGDRIDWGKIDLDLPPPLSAGAHLVCVKHAELRMTVRSTPSLMLKLYAQKEDRLLFDTLILTDEGSYKIKQLCTATGADLPDSYSHDDMLEFAKDIEDREVWVRLAARVFEGRGRNFVEAYLIKEAGEEEAN